MDMNEAWDSWRIVNTWCNYRPGVDSDALYKVFCDGWRGALSLARPVVSLDGPRWQAAKAKAESFIERAKVAEEMLAKAADTCGALESERNELLQENARLRREIERLQRRVSK
jgi:hypothetical protein